MTRRMFLACAVVALLASGCGGIDVVQPHVNVTIGQQLIDLKKARDSGALTESEFQRQKTIVIDSAR